LLGSPNPSPRKARIANLLRVHLPSLNRYNDTPAAVLDGADIRVLPANPDIC
jgi:hypothetical protein